MKGRRSGEKENFWTDNTTNQIFSTHQCEDIILQTASVKCFPIFKHWYSLHVHIVPVLVLLLNINSYRLCFNCTKQTCFTITFRFYLARTHHNSFKTFRQIFRSDILLHNTLHVNVKQWSKQATRKKKIRYLVSNKISDLTDKSCSIINVLRFLLALIA